MKHFVALAGNIGAGKSSLVEGLSNQLGWKPYYEPVAENPYLEDFYRDMDAWAFQSQVFFLAHRMRSHELMVKAPDSVVQDRSVYEDAEIFARNLSLQGHMSERDYDTYRSIFELFISLLDPPDLVIYIRASVDTLMTRITQRGRGFESQITEGYLSELNALYEHWISHYTLSQVLVIPGDDVDFVSEPAIVADIANKVEDMLDGKQRVLFRREPTASA